jgi:hypothetical protein
VFRQFLGIREEFLFQGRVFFGGLAPGPGPCQGKGKGVPFSSFTRVSGEAPAISISSLEK